jgi:hypothetical protein
MYMYSILGRMRAGMYCTCTASLEGWEQECTVHVQHPWQDGSRNVHVQHPWQDGSRNVLYMYSILGRMGAGMYCTIHVQHPWQDGSRNVHVQHPWQDGSRNVLYMYSILGRMRAGMYWWLPGVWSPPAPPPGYHYTLPPPFCSFLA